jgi:hypothetical protein
VIQRQGSRPLRPAPSAAGDAAPAQLGCGIGATAAALPAELAAVPPHLRLSIAYEDDHLACLVKPPGVPCDPPPGRGGGGGGGGAAAAPDGMPPGDGAAASGSAPRPAAPNAFVQMARLLAPSSALGALRRPRHVHRLDEPTGGLLLAAKTRPAQQLLCAAFEQRQVGDAAALACGPRCALQLLSLPRQRLTLVKVCRGLPALGTRPTSRLS